MLYLVGFLGLGFGLVIGIIKGYNVGFSTSAKNAANVFGNIIDKLPKDVQTQVDKATFDYMYEKGIPPFPQSKQETH